MLYGFWVFWVEIVTTHKDVVCVRVCVWTVVVYIYTLLWARQP